MRVILVDAHKWYNAQCILDLLPCASTGVKFFEALGPVIAQRDDLVNRISGKKPAPTAPNPPPSTNKPLVYDPTTGTFK